VSNNIDLNNPPANYRYKVTLDREETLGELRVRLVKDLGLFVFALVSVGAVYWLCYNTVTSPTAGLRPGSLRLAAERSLTSAICAATT
jgi:hypothetical protein